MKKLLLAFLIVPAFLFASQTSVMAQHYVQKGETMSSIAREHRMNLSDLIALNKHIENPNIIHPNDFIIIRSGTEPQKDLTEYARSLQSVTAYKYGGQNFPTSTDCSGWVQGIYKKFNVVLPRTSREQARTGTPVTFQNLQQGDLMFFSTRADKVITHTGIYLGNDFWISNLNEEKDVQILSTWGTWAQKTFLWGARHKL